MNLEDLKPNPKNPRKITDKKLKALAKSMKEFGDLGGIIFNKKTGQLIGGHQRKQILESVGVQSIDVRDDGHGFIKLNNGEVFSYREVFWDDSKEKAANIAANKGAGEWDMPQLTEWFKELDSLEFDLDLTMFDEDERKQFFVEPTVYEEGLTDPDSVPENIETRCKSGDLWLLGNHRLLCGDSTDVLQVDKLMGGEKADMVFTDPPYGINETGNRLSRGGDYPGQKYHDFKDDSIQYAIDAFNICQALEIPTQVWWGANYYCHSIPQSNNWLVWDKRVDEKNSDNNSDCELAWVKDSHNSVRIFRHLWKGMIKQSERGEKRVHPTQKPVELAIFCFDKYAGKSTLVLDLFLGSGSTLIACEKTKRECYGMELDPKYCDVIISRWEKFTGQVAVLAGSDA